MSHTQYAEADNVSLNSEMLLGDEGVSTQRSGSSSRKAMWLSLAAIGVVAVCAFGVAVSAHTRSMTVKSSTAELQASLGSTSAHASKAEKEAHRNFKSQFAGMMMMNQPVCRQTHKGYIACLDLVNSAQQLITDLTDPDVSVQKIMEHIREGTYNVGSATAFASGNDDTIISMAPGLKDLLEDPENSITVNDVADLNKCDYVWRGVACLSVINAGKINSAKTGCEEDSKPGECVRKIVAVIHILDDEEVEYLAGGTKVNRRRNSYAIGGVASGVAYSYGGNDYTSGGYLANPSRDAQIEANNAGALTRAEAESMGLKMGGRD